MKLPLRAASATSDMMIGVTAMASLVIYYAHRHVELFVAGPVATGTFIGSLLGAHLTTRLHSRVLTTIFVVLLLLTAVEMGVRATSGWHG